MRYIILPPISDTLQVHETLRYGQLHFEQECAECAKCYVFVVLIRICVPKVGKASLGLHHTCYWRRSHIDAVTLMFEI